MNLIRLPVIRLLLALGLVLALTPMFATGAAAAHHPPHPAPTPVHTTGSSYGSGSYYTYQPVTSQLSLNPFSGPPSKPVTVSGKWFYYYQRLTLYWDTKNRVLAHVTTNNQGTFTTTILPPVDTVGNHSICLLEAPWVQCQVFGLLPKVPPSVQFAPLEGQPGTSVTITGTNFNAGEVVAIVWSSTGKTIGNVIADGQGQVSGHFDLPEVSAGAYQVCLRPPPGSSDAPVCSQLTIDPVPVAAVNDQSAGLGRYFSYLIILLGLTGGVMFFLASRRRPRELPSATVEHRIGPVLMPSTYKEFWDSMRSPAQEDRGRRVGPAGS